MLLPRANRVQKPPQGQGHDERKPQNAVHGKPQSRMELTDYSTLPAPRLAAQPAQEIIGFRVAADYSFFGVPAVCTRSWIGGR